MEIIGWSTHYITISYIYIYISTLLYKIDEFFQDDIQLTTKCPDSEMHGFVDLGPANSLHNLRVGGKDLCYTQK